MYQVSRYHVGRSTCRHVYVDLYKWLFAILPTCWQGLSCIKACLYIYLYGYTNGLAGVMAAGGKTFIHLPIYVATCLSIDLLQILNIHTELIIYISLLIH